MRFDIDFHKPSFFCNHIKNGLPKKDRPILLDLLGINFEKVQPNLEFSASDDLVLNFNEKLRAKSDLFSSKIYHIADSLYQKRFIESKTDIDKFNRLFTAHECPKNLKIKWLKSDRLLMYLFHKMSSKSISLCTNNNYIRDIVDHCLFVKENGRPYSKQGLYNAKYKIQIKNYKNNTTELIDAMIVTKI
jgi:hypothetical protein